MPEHDPVAGGVGRAVAPVPAATDRLFVLVWSADLWLAHQGLIPPWFVDMRTAITALVCLILGLAYWLL